MNASHRTAARQARWSLGDVFDFECEVEEAKKKSDDALEREGRALRRKMGNVPLESLSRRELLFARLDLRRKESPESAGAEIDRAFRFARALMWIAGGLLGGMSTGGYLHYFGKEPVNVFWLLFLLVLFPLLLSGLAVLLALGMQDHSGLGVIGSRIFAAISRLSARKRQVWETWNGMMKKHGKRLLPLAKWPLLGLTQRFACAFGIGALFALWVRVVFTDIAFGWQSTVGWTPEAWHAAARFLAAPWTRAFPSGVPTLDQMRGSQFTHRGGMAALDASATQAWWPFLIGCITVYSVVLRGLFIALLGWNGRRTLARLPFDHSDANWLCRKLVGPLFPAGVQPASGELPARRSHPERQHSAGSWIALFAEGVKTDGSSLPARITRLLGGSILRIERVEIDYAGANAAVLDAIRNSTDRVAVVIPAATDPIEGIRKSLAQIASACAGREWVVLLHGDDERLPLWQRWADAVRLDLDLAMLPSS